ncbi:MAG: type II toxin-antitoxin system prevent-host-death family antitoxin [Alphaproteobacteria bacterium]
MSATDKIHNRWKLEDAKARFSEVVRLARTEGPQRVSVRGKDAVVVMSVEALARLMPPEPGHVPLVTFMEGLHLDGLDISRAVDEERDVDL